MSYKKQPGTVKKVRSAIILFITAAIWGTGFVAQSKAVNYIGPYTCNFLRSIIACVLLCPAAILYGKITGIGNLPVNDPDSKTERKKAISHLLLGGGLCGVMLTIGSNLQQIGLIYSTVGKAGFLTALYIVLVPIFGLFLGHKSHVNIWVSVAISTVGLYLLCITENFTIVPTDFYLLGCAVAFGVQIMTVSHFSPKTNGIWLSCIEFLVCSILSLILMLIYEPINLPMLEAALPSILYAAIFSSAIGYTLQIIGQEGLNPSIAALIMSLESVFSVLFGWVFLHEILNTREMFGCVFMLLAIVIVQIDFSSLHRK